MEFTWAPDTELASPHVAPLELLGSTVVAWPANSLTIQWKFMQIQLVPMTTLIQTW
jgi:hypothetical protein